MDGGGAGVLGLLEWLAGMDGIGAAKTFAGEWATWLFSELEATTLAGGSFGDVPPCPGFARPAVNGSLRPVAIDLPAEVSDGESPVCASLAGVVENLDSLLAGVLVEVFA